MKAAVLGVVGYSIVTVVDMACDTTLPAACLLDKVLADLACKLHYTSRSAVERASCELDLRSYATSRLAVKLVSCSTATRNGVDQAWLGLGRAFQCVVSVNG